MNIALFNIAETVKDDGDFEFGLNAFCFMILLYICGGWEVECGGLNVIGPHKLLGSGTVGNCGLVEVAASLWGGL